jgi:hypothetical protein
MTGLASATTSIPSYRVDAMWPSGAGRTSQVSGSDRITLVIIAHETLSPMWKRQCLDPIAIGLSDR